MRERLRTFIEPIELGWRVDRKAALSLAGFTVATTLGLPLRAIWFGLLIDALVEGASTSVYVFAVALSLTDGIRSWTLLQANMVKLDVQDRALLHLQTETMGLSGATATIAHHEDPAHIDRLAILRGGLSQLAGAYATAVESSMIVLRIAVTVVLLAWIDPILVFLPVFAIPSVLVGRRAERVNQAGIAKATPFERAAQQWERMLTVASAVKEVRIFRLTPTLLERFESDSARSDRVQTISKAKTELMRFAAWAVFGVGFALALVLLARRLSTGGVTAGDFVLALVLGAQVNMQVAEAVTATATMTALGGMLEHRRWLQDYATSVSTSGSAAVPERLERGIRLEGVTFAYGDGPKSLDEIDLFLPAGTTVALVGENGAGKTTLVKLLTRMYSPTAGTITVDDIDLEQIDASAWREGVTAAFQDFMRFEFRLRETVGVGDVAAITDEARINAAMARAGASSLVDTLPDGLESQVGPTFGGVDLSGGQWQGIALSRGQMRHEPLLQVLDEPTAALDPHAEQAIFETFVSSARHARLTTGAVTVLVSHRFSTVRAADLIVVLDHGRVVEQGSHEELVDAGGLYAELYELQARTYR